MKNNNTAGYHGFSIFDNRLRHYLPFSPLPPTRTKHLMKLSGPSRFVAAFIALFCMLFMQLAIAGYACPELKIELVSTAAAMSDAAGSMPGCMDMEQPSLCSAHAQAGDQSLDKAAHPQVQSFIAATLELVCDATPPASGPMSVQLDSIPLTRITAPPLSIRNCCFRI